jgi:hypothetical protein
MSKLNITVIIILVIISIVLFWGKENYSSIIDNTVNSNFNPNKDILIKPPFQEDVFKTLSTDYNEYIHNNRQAEFKKYSWMKNTFLGQQQNPQDVNNQTPFLSF